MLAFLDAPVLAVDLPPKDQRCGTAGSIRADAFQSLTVSDLADSLIADVDAAGFDRFVLVGHSMAGITIPEVARRIPDRVAHLVFVSASIPPEGGAIVDTLPAEVQAIMAESIAHAGAGEVGMLDEATTRFMFCNDMDEEQTRFVLDHLCPEGTKLISEVVSRAGIPPSLPKTFVRLRGDQSLPPDTQSMMIVNLEASPGGEVSVVELDSGHDVMISHPRELAAVVNRIAAG
jgi:pimeloyl-ACP methyl ester carboxylesterase